MRILVNGVQLYFDVEGAGLIPSGNSMQQKPTLLLLHGGPGADHSGYKPIFSELTDVAQVIYLDHRGNGRSDHGSQECWTLAQWADDVFGFCQALSIEKPIVYGASFGGIVAMTYALRHPYHPAKIALVSTTAAASSNLEAKVKMFGHLGGTEAKLLAERRYFDRDTSPEVLSEWLRVALPLYTQTPQTPQNLSARHREVSNLEVTAWFNRPMGEGRVFDLRKELGGISCPTLVLAGALDPMTPVECQREIVKCIRPDLVEYHEFDNCGHGVVADAPEQAISLIRQFILGRKSAGVA